MNLILHSKLRCDNETSTLLYYVCSLTTRNPLKELIVGKTKHKYYGPDDCIDDHVESKYFNNSEVSRKRKKFCQRLAATGTMTMQLSSRKDGGGGGGVYYTAMYKHMYDIKVWHIHTPA